MHITISKGSWGNNNGRPVSKKQRAFSMLAMSILFLIIGIVMIIMGATSGKNPYLDITQDFYFQRTGGTITITGEVTNKTDKTLTDVRLYFECEDSEGDYMGYFTSNPFTIEAGETYRVEELRDAPHAYNHITKIQIKYNGETHTLYSSGSQGTMYVGIGAAVLGAIFMLVFVLLLVKAIKNPDNKEPQVVTDGNNSWAGPDSDASTSNNATNAGSEGTGYKYCEYCGARNEKNASNCSSCGGKLK